MNTVNNKIRTTRDVIAFRIIAMFLVVLFALLCLIPIYLVIISSLTSEKVLVNEGFHFFIKEFSTEGYSVIFRNPGSILKAYGMTILVTCVGTLISVLMTVATGYVLSRRDFKWRNLWAFFFFFTTLFNAGLVPWYLWCSKYMGYNNHFHALLLPPMFSVWNMVISKNYIKAIPFEIIESAKLDGANDFSIFWRIIIPVSVPLIATMCLFSALAYWNDWYNCMCLC